MKSPKFGFSAPSIATCISEAAIKAIWKNKVKPQLRKQVLWDLIEFRDIDSDIAAVAKEIESEVKESSFRVSRPQTYLVEKSKGLCRQMMLIRPQDLIVLQCLSTRLHTQIVSSAPSKSAFFEPGQMKWSTGRMTISDGEYGSVASWKRFQKQVLKFSKENKYVVVADVANFYDFINFRHLRNIVAAICKDVDETLLDLLIHLLNELAWVPDYMPRQEIGMPQIEAEAPRVLANAMLFELDRLAESLARGNYARFMDDIDFGAKSIPEAKQIVRDIDLTLQSRQLRLNSAKTKILTQRDAFEHFCVRENRKLDRYARLLELTSFFKILRPRIGAALLTLYESWINRTATHAPGPNSPFLRGNGSKIHKRIFSLLRKCGVEPPLDDLVWLIKNDPGMRANAFRHITHTNRPNEAFNKILPILLSGTFVDDLAIIEFSNFVVHAKLKRTAKFLRGVDQAKLYLLSQGAIGAYVTTLILARTATPLELVDHSRNIFSLWKNSFWLGRCIAGLYPRVYGAGSGLPNTFLEMIARSGNKEARSVIDYHHRLINQPAFVMSSASYLKHDNETFPQKLYFPKALQILSVRHNAAAASAYSAIIKNHPVLATDPFFKLWGF